MAHAARAAARPSRAPTSRPPRKRAPARVFDWVIANPIATVTLAGLALYALLRVSLQQFYGLFGVEPEEVGLTYTDVIARAIVGVITIILFSFVTMSAFIAASVSAALDIARDLKRFRSPTKPPPLRERIRRALRPPVLLTSLLISVGVLVLILFLSASDMADEVRRGHSIQPSIGYRNALGLRVQRVTVRWLGETEPPALKRTGSQLMYLGRANGVAVLYDADNSRTLRVPDSQLLLVHE